MREVFYLNTYAETELLLKTAIGLSQNSVKQIAAECGIKPNCLYKWKTTDANLSPSKHDALLLYFLENEPQTIVAAAVLNYVLSILLDYLSSSTEEEVPKEE